MEDNERNNLLENARGEEFPFYTYPTLDTWELIFLALLIVMADKVGHTLHSLLMMTVSDPCLCTPF